MCKIEKNYNIPDINFFGLRGIEPDVIGIKLLGGSWTFVMPPSSWNWQISSGEDHVNSFGGDESFKVSVELVDSMIIWEIMRVEPPGKHNALRTSALTGSLRALPLVFTSPTGTNPCRNWLT